MAHHLDDPVVAEVRKIRAELAAKHGGSVEAILQRAQQMDKMSDSPRVRYSPRRVTEVAGVPASD